MSTTTIASTLPGRLRLRHPGLRQSRRCADAVALLAGWDGVTAAEGNPATGGVLLRYDPTRISPDRMEARTIAALDGLFAAAGPVSAAASPASRSAPKRLINIGMLASMAATLGALAYGKKLHALTGAAHLVFLAAHLVGNRNKLMRDLSLS